ncbi:peptide-methionine (S)-S-oxide reductase MsrA [Parasphingopyxis marina]|uniref:Peptide methionine sulfoxide reductase MsrA n=1 Tax=Parasphingopyxis marina TaxID=2761622 RepID=A0A842I1F4_9SPHN|nr:peptide-methionine (S)-S-oxide reductase MsrA [Parasphingopyxis marina]MBC2779072.1 peptide-methionine (S)-S-oxide reductase MsrA [Parasphingopyxis marina]
MTGKIITTLAIGGAAALAATAAVLLPGAPQAAEAAVSIPAPSVNVPATGSRQVAVLAGGCFWGMEGVFERIDGVVSVTSGYAGGTRADATYARVTTERTGHAEAVRIVYDPSEISYGQLLQVYFSVAHDPTQVNRQGPDHGPSYRSAIFPQDAAQRRAAETYIAQLNRSGRFPRRLATRIETGRFYRAEDYHQNFMRRNPRHPYILAHDVEKVRDLRATFPNLYRQRPAT